MIEEVKGAKPPVEQKPEAKKPEVKSADGRAVPPTAVGPRFTNDQLAQPSKGTGVIRVVNRNGTGIGQTAANLSVANGIPIGILQSDLAQTTFKVPIDIAIFDGGAEILVPLTWFADGPTIGNRVAYAQDTGIFSTVADEFYHATVISFAMDGTPILQVHGIFLA
jgi:hypothetical protein